MSSKGGGWESPGRGELVCRKSEGHQGAIEGRVRKMCIVWSRVSG